MTGYLGSRVIEALIANGNYDIRGTVRSLSNEKKMDPLRKAFGDNFEKLEIVEADLLDDASIDQAVDGCQYVIHVASPFAMANPANDDEYLKPAIDGTLSVLKAARKHRVERVVLTSSTAAILDRTKDGETLATTVTHS